MKVGPVCNATLLQISFQSEIDTKTVFKTKIKTIENPKISGGCEN